MKNDMDKYFNEVDDWFKDKKHEIVDECTLCSAEVKTHHLIMTDIVKCPACNLVFRYNQPTKTVLNKFYNQSTPMKTWSEIKSDRVLEATKQFSKFKYFIKFINDKSIPSILDYGCGNGLLLHMLPTDMKKVGVEVNKDAREIAKKDSTVIVVNKLEELKQTYDFISLCGVLEHLKQPYKTMNLLRTYLNKDGYVGIIVPNVDSLIIQLGKEKVSTFCPQHLTYFSIDTLASFMTLQGFKLVEYTTIEPELKPITNLLNNNYIYNPNETFFANKLMEKFILDNNLGYKIVAIFQKES